PRQPRRSVPLARHRIRGAIVVHGRRTRHTRVPPTARRSALGRTDDPNGLREGLRKEGRFTRRTAPEVRQSQPSSYASGLSAMPASQLSVKTTTPAFRRSLQYPSVLGVNDRKGVSRGGLLLR